MFGAISSFDMGIAQAFYTRVLETLSPRRIRSILLVAGSALAAIAVLGFFVVPPILRSVLTEKLAAALRREVRIQALRFNPFTLSLTINGFSMKEPGSQETFLSFEELFVNLEASSLLRFAGVVKELRLTRPAMRIVRRPDETYNFSDLLAGDEPSRNAGPALARFSLSNIRILDASLDFWDEPAGTKHTVREGNIAIPFLSTIPSYVEVFVQPAFSAKINGTQYALQGRTKPFSDSLESAFEINIADLDLPFYLAYSPVPMNFKLLSGRLDTKVALAFIQRKQGQQSLTVNGDLRLRELAIHDTAGDPLLRWQALEVSIVSAEPLTRKARLGRVWLQSPALTFRREKTGTLNLMALLPPPQAAAAGAETAEPAAEGLIEVDSLELAGGRVVFHDLATPVPFSTVLDPVELKVHQFSTRPETKATYTLAVKTEAEEEVLLDGGVALEPLAIEGTIALKGLPLAKYAPYYGDSLWVDVKGGRLDLSAGYTYAAGGGSPEIRASGIALSLRSLRLQRRGETDEFLQIPSLTVKDTRLDLSRREMIIGDVTTQRGSLTAKRLPDGTLDLQGLLAASPTPPPELARGAPAAKPWAVTLGRLLADQYAVTFEDHVPPGRVAVTAEQIRLTAEKISTAKNSTGRLSLDLLLDRATRLSARAAVSLEPLRAEGRLDVAGIALARYAPYYRDRVLFDVQDGTLDLATSYRLAQGGDPLDVKLSGLSAALRSLRLKARTANRDFLDIPTLTVKDADLDLLQRQVSVGEVSTERGTAHIVRSRDGEINLLALVPPGPVNPPGAGSAPGSGARAQPERPWLMRVGSVSASQFRVQVDDATAAEPVSLALEEVTLKADDLATLRGHTGKATLSLRLGQKGTVRLGGSVGLSPIHASLDVAVSDLDLRPVEPYFTDRVKILVTDGGLSASGRLGLDDQGQAGLRATYKGEIALAHFASMDKVKAEDFLRWESLALNEIDAGYNPLYFRAKKVALTDFYVRLVLHPDGSLNLQDILVRGNGTPGAPAEPARAAEPSPRPAEGAGTEIRIEEVTVQAGRVNFTDGSVKPVYSANLLEIGGRVSGLSSARGALADVDLRGKLENYAPLEITGKTHPLGGDLFVDLRARFRDMDLSPVTPYSGKYIGYTIQKGKLSFDVKYLIERRKLDSQNLISLDQLTLGDSVESPHATRLPVRLAIALLKDRNGDIRLDIPVTGSLDDPQFSVWRIVWQVIGNLIAKAVTSPFALLGAAFGGGEEMSHLEFEYGSAAVTPANQKKLEALIKAMHNRPSLRLDIESYVDVDRDRESLRQAAFTRKLQAQKALDRFKRGLPAVPLEELKIETPEYEKYLKSAYDFEKFPKPRTVLGMAKALPVSEMEKLMFTHTPVTDEDLRSLAGERAKAVRDAILRSGQVEPERVFILEPKSLSPEKKGGLRDSRADFKVK